MNKLVNDKDRKVCRKESDTQITHINQKHYGRTKEMLGREGERVFERINGKKGGKE